MLFLCPAAIVAKLILFSTEQQCKGKLVGEGTDSLISFPANAWGLPGRISSTAGRERGSEDGGEMKLRSCSWGMIHRDGWK